ncbi:DNA sulfur modification protein DndE [Ferrimonas balearica]|uniref:DNA sulfur modification protein DndE n=1 Tax=Ferrimonas balearica TaxID=44012 RepID=UPI001C95D0A7|nr:DNA sulfur modification protein DndE [Ferrimonas balearica]MBY5980539.1 DNA sulfur modification protein DndE [Ferrimonas balearica]
MLPNRMNLPKQVEEQLKKLKQYTGVTPNVAARIAFFRSIESGYRYQGGGRKLDGTLVLDKVTWLGETSQVTELMLQFEYPDLDDKESMKAWSAHVEDGIANIRNSRSILEFVSFKKIGAS